MECCSLTQGNERQYLKYDCILGELTSISKLEGKSNSFPKQSASYSRNSTLIISQVQKKNESRISPIKILIQKQRKNGKAGIQKVISLLLTTPSVTTLKIDLDAQLKSKITFANL